MRQFRSHGTGAFTREQLGSAGEHLVLEAGVLVFHPETVHLGTNVYVGHRTILKGHPHGAIRIGSDTWIGQDCFFHGAGGIRIGAEVGIGPGVRILTSVHEETAPPAAIIEAPLRFAPVVIGRGCDIGLGTILLPGVTIGEGVQVGAGSIVTRDLPDGCVASGAPARVTRMRGATEP
jgi:acetyltransferase-like isoleucine patch superfamily enzyme